MSKPKTHKSVHARVGNPAARSLATRRRNSGVMGAKKSKAARQARACRKGNW